MRIVRSPRPAYGYTTYDNQLVRDRRLSWVAWGILAELLSHRDGWNTDSVKLALSRPGVGRDTVRKALRELEALGYIERVKVRKSNAAGKLVWTTEVVVRDVPRGGFPTTDNDDQLDVASDDGHPVPEEVPAPEGPSSERPAETSDGDGSGTASDDRFPAVGRPAVGGSAASKKDQKKDQKESLSAAPAAARGNGAAAGRREKLLKWIKEQHRPGGKPVAYPAAYLRRVEANGEVDGLYAAMDTDTAAQAASPARPEWPPWCGTCDGEKTRRVYDDEGRPKRCTCHPLYSQPLARRS